MWFSGSSESGCGVRSQSLHRDSWWGFRTRYTGTVPAAASRRATEEMKPSKPADPVKKK